MACQVHTTLLNHEHAMPSTSHSSVSAHSLLDFACMGMAAVLPTVLLFAVLLLQVLHATPLMLKHTVLVFPPFIPPASTSHPLGASRIAPLG
jgi:hypothetical protein